MVVFTIYLTYGKDNQDGLAVAALLVTLDFVVSQMKTTVHM